MKNQLLIVPAITLMIVGCNTKYNSLKKEILKINNQMVYDILDYTEKAKTNPEYINNEYDETTKEFIKQMDETIAQIKDVYKPNELAKLNGVEFVSGVDNFRGSYIWGIVARMPQYNQPASLLSKRDQLTAEEYKEIVWQTKYDELIDKYQDNIKNFTGKADHAIFDITEKHRDLFPSPYDPK